MLRGMATTASTALSRDRFRSPCPLPARPAQRPRLSRQGLERGALPTDRALAFRRMAASRGSRGRAQAPRHGHGAPGPVVALAPGPPVRPFARALGFWRHAARSRAEALSKDREEGSSDRHGPAAAAPSVDAEAEAARNHRGLDRCLRAIPLWSMAPPRRARSAPQSSSPSKGGIQIQHPCRFCRGRSARGDARSLDLPSRTSLRPGSTAAAREAPRRPGRRSSAPAPGCGQEDALLRPIGPWRSGGSRRPVAMTARQGHLGPCAVASGRLAPSRAGDAAWRQRARQPFHLACQRRDRTTVPCGSPPRLQPGPVSRFAASRFWKAWASRALRPPAGSLLQKCQDVLRRRRPPRGLGLATHDPPKRWPQKQWLRSQWPRLGGG